jgi:hypothetical protein
MIEIEHVLCPVDFSEIHQGCRSSGRRNVVSPAVGHRGLRIRTLHSTLSAARLLP